MIFNEYSDRDTMMTALAGILAGELRASLEADAQTSLAVPGGSTPGPIFDALCGADLDWSSVHVMLTDERRVPPDHERSNERLLRQRLLIDRAAKAKYVSIVPPSGEPTLPANLLPLSVLVLGMGADMHTASLFPGSPDLTAALAPDAAPLMFVEASDGLEPRVTMTAHVLSSARSTHVLIAGADKREALERAQKATLKEAPIRTVLDQAKIHWAP
jgi:6-phosphogluconolactonase